MQLVAVLRALFFMDFPHFKPRIIQIHVTHVNGISVPIARPIHALAIMVDCGCALDDFVKTIAINIPRTQVVVALAFVCIVVIKCPPLGKGRSIPIVGSKGHTGVVAPLKNHTWLYTIQIGIGGHKAVHTIAIAVTPCRHGPSRRRIIESTHLLSGFSVEDADIFWTSQNVARRVAVVGRVVVGSRGPFA